MKSTEGRRLGGESARQALGCLFGSAVSSFSVKHAKIDVHKFKKNRPFSLYVKPKIPLANKTFLCESYVLCAMRALALRDQLFTRVVGTMEEGWSEEAPATNGFSETRLVLKIQHLESEYRNRVDRLEKDYDSRIRSLAHVLMKAFRDIPTDPMINTMERNPVSKEYIAARVNEILKEAVQNDTENNIKSLTKRLSNTETEVSRWKKEYRKVTGDASETKMKLESARLSSKELQKTIEAQAKKIKELQGYC
eukprot:jgi/Bigna1/133986/aug1.23_g8694